ncbi:hypothetical protein [Streptomyces sporangiiformans]|uniref:hypothetical protein n=1 Tax=Streptomyces sporangiiformans TaxID=2315329 RepID=UPI0013C41E15|nr:hypothetical protein [Streptomyces sporangiiformans]
MPRYPEAAEEESATGSLGDATAWELFRVIFTSVGLAGTGARTLLDKTDGGHS